MKYVSLALHLLFAIFITQCSDENHVAIGNSNEGTNLQKICGSYIVVLNDNTFDVQNILKCFEKKFSALGRHIYQKALKGFSISIYDKIADKLADDPDYILALNLPVEKSPNQLKKN